MKIKATQALAQRMRAEMQDYGYTHDEVKARGGPSSPTLTKILSGDGSLIAEASVRKLETALGWHRGDAARIAAGKPARVDRFPDVDARQAVAAQLNPALRQFTDHELVAELEVRLLLSSARLQALGAGGLEFVTDPSGERVVTSRPDRSGTSLT